MQPPWPSQYQCTETPSTAAPQSQVALQSVRGGTALQSGYVSVWKNASEDFIAEKALRLPLHVTLDSSVYAECH